jgi:hypothetical protein
MVDMSDQRGLERPVYENAILDIGGDIGALILTTGAEYAGREIEISPIKEPAARIHTAIHERRIGDRVVYAGIYPQLKAGTYRIWIERPELTSSVTIIGGEVVEVDWPAPETDPPGQVGGSDQASR